MLQRDDAADNNDRGVGDQLHCQRSEHIRNLPLTTCRMLNLIVKRGPVIRVIPDEYRTYHQQREPCSKIKARLF